MSITCSFCTHLNPLWCFGSHWVQPLFGPANLWTFACISSQAALPSGFLLWGHRGHSLFYLFDAHKQTLTRSLTFTAGVISRANPAFRSSESAPFHRQCAFFQRLLLIFWLWCFFYSLLNRQRPIPARHEPAGSGGGSLHPSSQFQGLWEAPPDPEVWGDVQRPSIFTGSSQWGLIPPGRSGFLSELQSFENGRLRGDNMALVSPSSGFSCPRWEALPANSAPSSGAHLCAGIFSWSR